MKVTKYILLGLAMVATTTFTSCNQDNEGEVYSLQSMGVTFANSAQTANLPAYGYDGVDFELIRAKSTEAATVNLTAKLKVGKATEDLPAEISVPATASFAAGEFKTTVHISVGDIRPGKTYDVVVSIADDSLLPVDATNQKTISIFRDYTYSAIGTGKIISTAFESEGDIEWELADDITWYKALQPYEKGYDVVFKVGADGKTVTVAKQAICKDISGYGTGYVAGSGELKDGVMTLSLEFTVSAGSLGSFKETFILPESEK